MHRVHMCVTTGARLSYIYFLEEMEVSKTKLSEIILEYHKGNFLEINDKILILA